MEKVRVRVLSSPCTVSEVFPPDGGQVSSPSRTRKNVEVQFLPQREEKWHMSISMATQRPWPSNKKALAARCYLLQMTDQRYLGTLCETHTCLARYMCEMSDKRITDFCTLPVCRQQLVSCPLYIFWLRLRWSYRSRLFAGGHSDFCWRCWLPR